MSRWIALALAVGAEITATLSLRAAVDAPAFYALVIVGYVSAFVMLAKVLTLGMPLGVAYGIWGASGVAATAVLAVPLFGEPFTLTMAVGLVVLIAGVVTVEVGSQRARDLEDTERVVR